MVEVEGFELTVEEFAEEIRRLITQEASAKNYSETALFDEIARLSGGPNLHALGEIVYKAHRYVAKCQYEDLLKIGAWAFLLADWHRRHFHTKETCLGHGKDSASNPPSA